MCVWTSLNPGTIAPPCASTTWVFAPRRRLTSSFVPTVAIRLPRTATACDKPPASPLWTAPLMTIRSAALVPETDSRCAVAGRDARIPDATATHAMTTSRPLRLFMEQFLHGTVCLIDRLIGIRGGRGVGVRNGDASKRLAADLARSLPFRPVRIPEGVVLVRVSVRPPVDGDRVNV